MAERITTPTLEEMTRRRDAWRGRAQSAAAELGAAEVTHRQTRQALERERAHSGSLRDQVTAARAEAALNLAWVRRLQKEVEGWKLNSKKLAQLYVRQGRVVAWIGPISKCPTRHDEPRRCLLDCADRCGVDAEGCFGHEHCDMCGAIRCHGFWWRRRW